MNACRTLSVHLVDGSQRKVAHTRHLANQFCGCELLEVKSVIHCKVGNTCWDEHNCEDKYRFYIATKENNNPTTGASLLPCKLDVMLCSPFSLVLCLSSRGLS